MANEAVTHVEVTLDQAMLQTIRMGLAAIQLNAVQVEAHLNEAVQAAIEGSKGAKEEGSPAAPPNKFKAGLGTGRT